MNRQAGRSGSVWRRTRLAVLRASHGICALCGNARCPKHGRFACDGLPAPGQVHHVVPPDLDPTRAEDRSNLLAAHGCCNRARNRLSLLQAELVLAGRGSVSTIRGAQGGTPAEPVELEGHTGPLTSAERRPSLVSEPPVGTPTYGPPPRGACNGVHGRLVANGG